MTMLDEDHQDFLDQEAVDLQGKLFCLMAMLYNLPETLSEAANEALKEAYFFLKRAILLEAVYYQTGYFRDLNASLKVVALQRKAQEKAVDVLKNESGIPHSLRRDWWDVIDELEETKKLMKEAQTNAAMHLQEMQGSHFFRTVEM